MRRIQSLLIGLIVVSLSGGALAAQAASPASLAGVVRDSTGTPLVGVEVLVSETTRGTRSDSAGRFVLAEIVPGAHRISFRRLGYASAQFDWAARAGERTELAVVLHAIARTLDPVVVRAQEDKDMAARASLLGLVVDTTGTPIEEAEVQLVGANRSGLTRANGGFLFRPLRIGPYVVRIRKLGYEPSVLKLNLVQGDDREVIVRMRPLARTLDAMVVTARSGYDGRDQLVFDDLERRLHWRSFKNPVLGPEDLKRFYGLDLDYAMKALSSQIGGAGPRNVPTSIMGSGRGPMESRLDQYYSDACVLLNGKTPMRRPLRTFNTADIDLLEIYPPGTELTGTIDARMVAQCKAASLFKHPWYYVIWLKGAR